VDGKFAVFFIGIPHESDLRADATVIEEIAIDKQGGRCKFSIVIDIFDIRIRFNLVLSG